MESLPWIIAFVAMALLAALLATWALPARKSKRLAPLPTEWALTPRPVFSTDERRVYRLLREALPHHIVLSKLPLVRFCQPTDPSQVRYWYDLLGSNHATFAVCSTNGRVLAAIDLDTDRGNSRRVLEIKQSVLGACRVRYLRCPVDHLPTVAELQLLVPSSNAPGRGPQPAPAPPYDLTGAGESPTATVATKRSERSALWHDSTLFQDSFFAPDNRLEGFGSSEPSPLSEATPPSRASTPSLSDMIDEASYKASEPDPEDVGGVVVDNPDLPPPRR
jgi:hypothetical protein